MIGNENKNRKELKDTIINWGLGFIVGASLSYSVASYLDRGFNPKSFPNTDKVQQGYVVPSKLEMSLKDIDGDGQKEFRIIYDGKPYLFRLDENKKPVAQEYSLTKPEAAKIVIKE
jgi:hypothetical protein